MPEKVAQNVLHEPGQMPMDHGLERASVQVRERDVPSATDVSVSV